MSQEAFEDVWITRLLVWMVVENFPVEIKFEMILTLLYSTNADIFLLYYRFFDKNRHNLSKYFKTKSISNLALYNFLLRFVNLNFRF